LVEVEISYGVLQILAASKDFCSAHLSVRESYPAILHMLSMGLGRKAAVGSRMPE